MLPRERRLRSENAEMIRIVDQVVSDATALVVVRIRHGADEVVGLDLVLEVVVTKVGALVLALVGQRHGRRVVLHLVVDGRQLMHERRVLGGWQM
jgi:translation initiation factor 2B subunit (eIF-2B alpha/beta/delta family)